MLRVIEPLVLSDSESFSTRPATSDTTAENSLLQSGPIILCAIGHGDLCEHSGHMSVITFTTH